MGEEHYPKLKASRLLVSQENEMKDCGILNVDLAFEVLSRFLTKDLIEWETVSKGWKELITSGNFVKVQSQKKQPLSGFFFQQRYQWCQDDIKTINYIPVKFEAKKLQKEVFSFLPEDVVFLTSCSGLVCCRSCFPLEEKPSSLFVCNPLRKEWIKIDWINPDKEDSIALAFDPCKDFIESSANFKLVRVLQSRIEKEEEEEEEEFYYSFEVYSSKMKSWELSMEICQSNSNLYKNKGAYIKGILHWLTEDNQILTFDIQNDLSLLISAPLPAIGFESIPEACIGESEDTLHYIMISEQGIQVWFLEDYFELNWSLKYSKTLTSLEQENGRFLINLQEKVKQRMIDPLAFKDGILLLRVSNTFYLYKIELSRMEKVCDISGFGSYSMFSPIVFPYSMSLVPLLDQL